MFNRVYKNLSQARLKMPFHNIQIILKRKINLEIKDYRDSFNEPHKKKPYYLFVEFGERKFVFSNKKTANRFLSMFKNESTELFCELGQHLEKLFYYNISLVQKIDFLIYKKNLENLKDYALRYSYVLHSKNDIVIGREILNLYYSLLDELQTIKKILQSNNRSNTLLRELKSEIKSIKRLKKDFDLLLFDITGVREVTNDKNISVKPKNILRIA